MINLSKNFMERAAGAALLTLIASPSVMITHDMMMDRHRSLCLEEASNPDRALSPLCKEEDLEPNG